MHFKKHNKPKPEPLAYDEGVRDEILSYLDGWVIQLEPSPTKDEEDEETTTLEEPDDIYSELNNSKKITDQEIQQFYTKTIKQVKRYLGRDPKKLIKNNPIEISEAICCWCAGLLWKKANVKAYEQNDETNQVGYGDGLIKTAREDLRPYRFSKLEIW